jgi:hypothetical protein
MGEPTGSVDCDPQEHGGMMATAPGWTKRVKLMDDLPIEQQKDDLLGFEGHGHPRGWGMGNG